MARLLGHDKNQSTKIDSLIEQLVAEVHSASKHIEGPRGPQPEFEAKAKIEMEKLGKVRGRPLYFPYIGTGVGRGPYVEIEDGSIKLDLINGIGVHLFGHSHPKVLEASVRGALSDIVMQGNLQPNAEYEQMSSKLVQIASKKSRIQHCWLSTCGTIANENALKICRQKKTPARKIMAMEAAFAGRSTLMAEVTDNPSFRVGLPEYNEVLRVPFYNKKDARSSERALTTMKKFIAENPNNIGVFTFEPMQGEGGYNVAPREFFIPLLELCREHKIPVWVDEVQTFARTGEFFAFETLGFGDYVDVVTVAKTIQAGATLYTAEMNPQPGLISGTFSGGSSALMAGLAMIEMMEKEDYLGKNGKIAKIHNEFVEMLNRLNTTTCKDKLQDVDGLGLMVGFTPLDGSKEKAEAFVKTLYKNGLMSFGCGRGPYRVRVLIPAVMSSQDIKVAEKIIEKSIAELA